MIETLKKKHRLVVSVVSLFVSISILFSNTEFSIIAFAKSIVRVERREGLELSENNFFKKTKGTLEKISADFRDGESLKNDFLGLVNGSYNAVLEFSYELYPVNIRWAYEHEHPDSQQQVIEDYAENYRLSGNPVLDRDRGTILGPVGRETYYNLDMSIIINYLESNGVRGRYYIRHDGVKMYGRYIMVAASYAVHPYGSIVETSLGKGIVCDTGGFAAYDPFRLDIATSWY